MVAQAVLRKRYFTPEEYLALERKAEFKSEYYCGDIYAMAEASPDHNAITANVTVAIGSQLRDKPCRIFSPDLKVRTDPSGLFSYPDVSVVCGELRFHDVHRDVVTNPTVIVEVLSPTTEAFDRGKKFAQYQTIESLTDYIMVAQDEPRVEHYARQVDNIWLLTTATGLGGEIHIASIGCTLLLAEVYDKIKFDEEAAP